MKKEVRAKVVKVIRLMTFGNVGGPLHPQNNFFPFAFQKCWQFQNTLHKIK